MSGDDSIPYMIGNAVAEIEGNRLNFRLSTFVPVSTGKSQTRNNVAVVCGSVCAATFDGGDVSLAGMSWMIRWKFCSESGSSREGAALEQHVVRRDHGIACIGLAAIDSSHAVRRCTFCVLPRRRFDRQ